MLFPFLGALLAKLGVVRAFVAPGLAALLANLGVELGPALAGPVLATLAARPLTRHLVLFLGMLALVALRFLPMLRHIALLCARAMAEGRASHVYTHVQCIRRHA